jgi:hypothetical protein
VSLDEGLSSQEFFSEAGTIFYAYETRFLHYGEDHWRSAGGVRVTTNKSSKGGMHV